jgi:hypothetical protein
MIAHSSADARHWMKCTTTALSAWRCLVHAHGASDHDVAAFLHDMDDGARNCTSFIYRLTDARLSPGGR